jgi:lambda repressor-like predicted transcriptional regulator
MTKSKPNSPKYILPKADPITPGIHIAFIKAALMKAGYSQKRVADENGVTPPSINNIIKGHTRSLRVAKFIAEKTGLTIEEMWPGFYKEEEEQKKEEIIN